MPIDYSKYPPNWKTEIRPRIMKRANNTCEFEGCDFKHLEFVWAITINKRVQWFRDECNCMKAAANSGWNCQLILPITRKVRVVLTIAHLDHDEENQDITDDRLRAACQLCHLRYDAEEKALRRKAIN